MRSTFHILALLYQLLQYRIDQMILPIHRSPSFWLAPVLWFSQKNNHLAPRGKRLADCLIQLGPICIKMGQALSTRRDILPKDIADALETLQDNVPAFATDTAISMIEHTLGPIANTFARFDTMPLAAASIAQVHSAMRHDGREVIVKILRPNIHQRVEKDLRALRWLARWIERLHPQKKQLQAHALVETYARILKNELDLLKEASNYSQMRHYFQSDARMVVPKIHWDLTSNHLMVAERIWGIKISAIHQLTPAIDAKKLAVHGVGIFFEQLLDHNFFHADMHPGNIFVDIRNPWQPRYMAVDFGIVGTLSKSDQSYIAHNLVAFFNRDYETVAKLHLESGWVPADTSVQDMAASLRAIGESIYAKPLKDISFADLFSKLLHVARNYQMIVQPQLILLQKTLFNIEALGRSLYPELNIWDIAAPKLNRWVTEKHSIQTPLTTLHKQLPRLLHTLDQHLSSPSHSTPAPKATHPTFASFTYGVLLGVFLTALLMIYLPK